MDYSKKLECESTTKPVTPECSIVCMEDGVEQKLKNSYLSKLFTIGWEDEIILFRRGVPKRGSFTQGLMTNNDKYGFENVFYEKPNVEEMSFLPSWL